MTDGNQAVAVRLYSAPAGSACSCAGGGCGAPDTTLEMGFRELLARLQSEFGRRIRIETASYENWDAITAAYTHLAGLFAHKGLEIGMTRANFPIVLAALAPILTVGDTHAYLKKAPAYEELRSTVMDMLNR